LLIGGDCGQAGWQADRIPAASTLTASRRVLSLAIAQQPRIDIRHFVASPRLKIQQRRPRIL